MSLRSFHVHARKSWAAVGMSWVAGDHQEGHHTRIYLILSHRSVNSCRCCQSIPGLNLSRLPQLSLRMSSLFSTHTQLRRTRQFFKKAPKATGISRNKSKMVFTGVIVTPGRFSSSYLGKKHHTKASKCRAKEKSAVATPSLIRKDGDKKKAMTYQSRSCTPHSRDKKEAVKNRSRRSRNGKKTAKRLPSSLSAIAGIMGAPVWTHRATVPKEIMVSTLSEEGKHDGATE